MRYDQDCWSHRSNGSCVAILYFSTVSLLVFFCHLLQFSVWFRVSSMVPILHCFQLSRSYLSSTLHIPWSLSYWILRMDSMIHYDSFKSVLLLNSSSELCFLLSVDQLPLHLAPLRILTLQLLFKAYSVSSIGFKGPFMTPLNHSAPLCNLHNSACNTITEPTKSQ